MKAFEKAALGGWLLVAGAAGALGAGLATLSALERVQLCLFRLVTGWRCPGCGMGHALLAAFQGRWAESFAEHPLGIPVLLVWTFWLAWGLAGLRNGRGFSEGFPLRLDARRGAAAGAAVLAVYAVRVLT